MPAPGDGQAVAGLAEAVEELYVLPPEDFTGRRDALASEARAAGDKALAAAVRRLRRPTTSAWALNLLSREEPDLVAQLLEVGAALRQAQEGLDGTAMRELNEQRRAVVGGLTRRAGDLAQEREHPLDAAMSRQVEQSLAAALADPAAGEAVTSGQLTTPVSSAGFGFEVDPEAVAVPSLVLLRGGRAPAATPARGRATRPRDGSDRSADEPAVGGAARAGRKTRPDSLADARARKKQERDGQRAEDERVEQERVAQERAEQERAEQERAEQERAEQERAEQERRRAEVLAALEAARGAEDDAQQDVEAVAGEVSDLQARVDTLDEEAEQLRARLAEVEEERAAAVTDLETQQQRQAGAEKALTAARRATRTAERAATAADTRPAR